MSIISGREMTIRSFQCAKGMDGNFTCNFQHYFITILPPVQKQIDDQATVCSKSSNFPKIFNRQIFKKLFNTSRFLLVDNGRLFLIRSLKQMYRGSPPYAFFGTWKKPCYMKLVLVGLYCGPLLTLIPPLTRT